MEERKGLILILSVLECLHILIERHSIKISDSPGKLVAISFIKPCCAIEWFCCVQRDALAALVPQMRFDGSE